MCLKIVFLWIYSYRFVKINSIIRIQKSECWWALVTLEFRTIYQIFDANVYWRVRQASFSVKINFPFSVYLFMFFFSCRTSTKTSSITSGTSRISPTYRIPQSETRICPIRIPNPFSRWWRRTRSKQFCQSSSQWTTWPWTTSSPNLWNSKIIRCGIRRSFRYY